MGEIIVSENVSLDGVIQDPAGDEGFRLGGWVGQIKGEGEAAKILLDEALGAQALLLGRRSYEFFAARWPSRGGALADRLNSMPKYVVSSTLQEPAWNNVHTLMEHDLVDELRLMIYPVVLGAGERLFGETSDKKPMRLASRRRKHQPWRGARCTRHSEHRHDRRAANLIAAGRYQGSRCVTRARTDCPGLRRGRRPWETS
jgi:dihydrofolate reductase